MDPALTDVDHGHRTSFTVLTICHDLLYGLCYMAYCRDCLSVHRGVCEQGC